MKSKKLYKKIVTLTFLLPMLGLLVYFFISSNKGVEVLLEAPHVVMVDVNKEYDVTLDLDQHIFVNPVSQTITVNSSTIKFNDITISGSVMFPITELVYIQNNYYKVTETNELKKVDITNIVKESLFLTKFSAGLTIILALAIASIIGLIVFKKMELYKKYKRISVLITSLMITIIFLMLSAITTQIFLIFGTFTICWTIYYIEWMLYRKANGLTLSEYTPEKVVIVNG